MQKKFAGIMLVMIILALLLPFSSLAAGQQLWDSYEVPNTRQKPRLVDQADLLSDTEEKNLLSTLDSLSAKWKCNIVVLTVDSHTGPIEAYADDYFDYNGFGADYSESGILFMLSMEDREWAISTAGDAIRVFTDYGQDYMFNQMRGDLSDGDYYGAFNTYATVCDKLLDQAASGTPYDVNQPQLRVRTASDYLAYLGYSVIIGLVVALFPILKMKSDLKTVHMNASASGYQSQQGMRMSVNSDRLVNKTLSKTPLPKDNDSSSSRGGGWSGGSSTHTSSSGHSHGGSHGHF
ncbi:TPM domain-containing protein [Butyrivibrio sp. FCS014]|uniref:TPM domain-containing protein n=1 Tax=Butyrivibrio sp. FCS014 TaxID=1408304 RepID=UPI000467404C|nr:TPM domain-containing protein [Butyrivibrio sp. FCS014]